MKRILQISILLLLCHDAFPQSMKIGMESGIGFYSMSDLKEFNSNIQDNLPIETELTSEFPPYFYYRPMVQVYNEDVHFGVFYLYQTTGSRISTKDYTGKYRFDMQIKSLSPGVHFRLNISDTKRLRINLYSNVGARFTHLKLDEYFKLYNNVLTNQTNKFESLNLFFEPGFNIEYPYKFLSFQFSAGYSINIKPEKLQSKNSEGWLYDDDNDKAVRPQWNGFRFGLSVYIILRKL